MADSKQQLNSFRILLLCFVCLLCFEVVLFAFMFRIMAKYRRDFKVDEDVFLCAVDNSVSKFLSNLSVDTNVNTNNLSEFRPEFSGAHTESREESSNFTCNFVPGLGFFRSFSGVNFAVYRGQKFREGDFLFDGVIELIADSRLVVRNGKKYVVYRPGAADVLPVENDRQTSQRLDDASF